MKTGLNNKSAELRDLVLEEFAVYAKFFQAPLPLYLFSSTFSESLKESLLSSLQEQNEMGKKLLTLTSNFYKLCESNFKSIENLEAFKQSAVLKIEGLERTISEFKFKEKEGLDKLKDLNEHIAHLENRIEETQSVNEDLNSELDKIKLANEKMKESQESQLKDLIEFHKVDKENLKCSIETLQKSLSSQQEYVKGLEEDFESVSKALVQEKSATDATRASVNRLKSELHELKLALQSVKLKKFTYKQLSKASTYNFRRNTHPCAELDHSENSETEEKGDSNDLLALEEEQSLAQSLTNFSVEFKDELSLQNASGRKSESLIVVFPPKPEEKLKIVLGEGCSIRPKSKSLNFSVSPTLNYAIRPTRSLNLLSNQGTQLVCAIKTAKLMKNGRLLIPKVLTPKNSSIKVSERFGARDLKMETWSESFVKKKETVKMQESTIVSQFSIKPHNFAKVSVEGTPADPVKAYFIDLCHKIKADSDYSPKVSQIPTSPLYSSLVGSNTPLYKWPESIQLYLARRINQV